MIANGDPLDSANGKNASLQELHDRHDEGEFR